MEGGSAQEGGDITTQPLKDEPFPPPLQLLGGVRTSGSPAGTEGVPEVPVWLTLDKGAPRAGAGPVASPLPGGQEVPAQGESWQVSVPGADFSGWGESSLPFPVLTSNKTGSTQEE